MSYEEEYLSMSDVNQCPFFNTCDKVGTTSCTMHCVEAAYYRYMLYSSKLPNKLKRNPPLYFDTYKDKTCVDKLKYILANIVDFVKNGYNVYLYGSPGTGKTAWAGKFMTYYFEHILPDVHSREMHGLYVNVPNLLFSLKFDMGNYSTEFRNFIRQLNTVDLIIWDDLYQSMSSAYDIQTLYNLINSRIDNEKSNIYTSNVSPQNISRTDFRMFSRLCATSDCIELVGDDMRKSWVNYTDNMNI